MTNLIERLRDYNSNTYAYDDCMEAADELERLIAELAEAKEQHKAEHISNRVEYQHALQANADLTVTIERLRVALEDATKAIESLDNDALGYGQAPDGQGDVYHWLLKDELLSKCREALQGDSDD